MVIGVYSWLMLVLDNDFDQQLFEGPARGLMDTVSWRKPQQSPQIHGTNHGTLTHLGDKSPVGIPMHGQIVKLCCELLGDAW